METRLCDVLFSYWAGTIDDNDLCLWLRPRLYRWLLGRSKLAPRKRGRKRGGARVIDSGFKVTADKLEIVALVKPSRKREREGERVPGSGHAKQRKPQARNRLKPLFRHGSKSGTHLDEKQAVTLAGRKRRITASKVREQAQDLLGDVWVAVRDGTMAENMVKAEQAVSVIWKPEQERDLLEIGFWKTVSALANKRGGSVMQHSRQFDGLMEQAEQAELLDSVVELRSQEREQAISLTMAIVDKVSETISKWKHNKQWMYLLDGLEQGKSVRKMTAELRQNGTRITRKSVAKKIVKLCSLMQRYAEQVDTRPSWLTVWQDFAPRAGVDFVTQAEREQVFVKVHKWDVTAPRIPLPAHLQRGDGWFPPSPPVSAPSRSCWHIMVGAEYYCGWLREGTPWEDHHHCPRLLDGKEGEREREKQRTAERHLRSIAAERKLERCNLPVPLVASRYFRLRPESRADYVPLADTFHNACDVASRKLISVPQA